MRKHVKARIERNRALGAKDAAKRCAYCRRATDGSAYFDYTIEKRFCNDGCWEDYLDRQARRNP